MSVPLPANFDRVRAGSAEIIVARDVRTAIEPILFGWANGAPPVGRELEGGRGGTVAITAGDGTCAVLRPYRRGGAVARVNDDLYFGRAPRPIRELTATARLVAAGVPTAEPLGAVVRWCGPLCYRGAIATREIVGAENLWVYLRRVERERRILACRAVTAVTRRMHDAGAVHPDLNLQNYLVRETSRGLGAWIIDCDGLQWTPVGPRQRQAAFDRICRSIRRLDPIAEILTLACIETLSEIAFESSSVTAD